ncbi:unnamed protein product [Mytilus edulis]|uniref:Uncharacterized protein n=1 Tax=Mytilus edulis TaxID=6550 RepID=A0A8S3VEM9_MYTED|nr:unnamed protein product [Mytilus edulis]
MECTSQSAVIYFVRVKTLVLSVNGERQITVKRTRHKVRYYIRLRHGEPSRQITVKRTRHKSDITRLRHREPSRQITVKRTRHKVLSDITYGCDMESLHVKLHKENTIQSVLDITRLRHGEPSRQITVKRTRKVFQTAARAFTSNYSKENTIQSVVRYYIRLRHGEPSRQITVKRTRYKVLSDITYGCDMENFTSNYSKEKVQSVVRYYIRLRHGEPSRQITVKRTRYKVLSDITYGCDMESLHVKLQ